MECVYKREKRPNLLNTESKHFCDKHWKQKKRPNPLTTKVSRNMETTNSFEYGNNDFCDTQTHRQFILYINHHDNDPLTQSGLCGGQS